MAVGALEELVTAEFQKADKPLSRIKLKAFLEVKKSPFFFAKEIE
jgi:hypothetical protein